MAAKSNPDIFKDYVDNYSLRKELEVKKERKASELRTVKINNTNHNGNTILAERAAKVLTIGYELDELGEDITKAEAEKETLKSDIIKAMKTHLEGVIVVCPAKYSDDSGSISRSRVAIFELKKASGKDVFGKENTILEIYWQDDYKPLD